MFLIGEERTSFYTKCSSFESTETSMQNSAWKGRKRGLRSIRSRLSLSQSMRWFLISSSCFYLLSESNGVTIEDEEQSGRKRFLRTAVAAAASASAALPNTLSEPPPTDMLAENAEEEFDYESYHAKHHIPVPALSATMMGLQHQSDIKSDNEIPLQRKGIYSFAGTNQAIKSFASENNYSESLGDEQNLQRRGPLAFAGTNQAMQNFASGSNEDTYVSEGRRILTIEHNNEQLPNSEMQMESIPESSKEQLLEQNETDSNAPIDSNSHAATLSDTDSDTDSDSPPQLPKQKSPTRTDADLDNGRYLVGLEIRDIKVHQQIILDYHDTNDFGEKSIEPLRIKLIASDGVDKDPLFLSLIENSFKDSAEMWSSSLSLVPVSGRITPSVDICGSANIPLEDREKGVNGADTLIYISGDNRFCGGALMHSAVCDFDQNMRPLVGNINICTKNIPTNEGTQSRISFRTLDLYTSYITTEMSRVLGASTSFFRHYKNPDTSIAYGTIEKLVTCVDGTKETIEVPNMIRATEYSGEISYEIRTPKVIEVVRNHFDCMTLTGAKLESKKSATSCFGAYLDDHLFFGDQLSAFQSIGSPSLSPLTLALLEDSSWYVANYTASTEIPFGRGSGCQFAHDGCVSHSNNNNWGFHCTDIDAFGCDPSHSFKAFCDFLQTSNGSADSFCPMFVRGAIDCSDESNLSTLAGEHFGDGSKCFNTDRIEPMCLKAVCNELDYTIDIHYENELFQCSYDGQIIDTNKDLRIECPRIAAVCPHLHCPSNCSGKGVCDEGRDGRFTCICDNPFDNSPGCWAN